MNRGVLASALQWDDDLGDLELPQPAEILDSEYRAPDFEVEAFLLRHTQFHSLRDLVLKLKEWDNRYVSELRSSVETQYEDFLAIGTPLTDAKDQSQAVHIELLRFKNAVEEQRKVLVTLRDDLKTQVKRKRATAVASAVAQTAIWAQKSYDGIEALIKSLDQTNLAKPDCQAILAAAKRCVSLASLSSKPAITANDLDKLTALDSPNSLTDTQTVVAAVAAEIPVFGIKAGKLAAQLIALISEAIPTIKDDTDVAFELISARAWLNGVKEESEKAALEH